MHLMVERIGKPPRLGTLEFCNLLEEEDQVATRCLAASNVEYLK